MRLKDPLLLALAILAAFGSLLWAPFVYDDARFILESGFVAGPWPGLWAILSGPVDASGAYEPLVTLLHRLLFSLAGPNPIPYRLSSLLLHWLNACLVLALFRRLLGDARLAFWGALLFALHPAHAEVLAVSTFKTHLAASGFGLLAVVLAGGKLVARPALWGSWAAFFLGLLSKETAIVAPVLAWVLDRTHAGDRGGGRRRILFAGWLAIAVAYALWRFAAIGRPAAPLMGGGEAAHLLTSGKIFLWYVGHLLIPAGLCLEHSLAVVEPVSLTALGVVLGCAAAAACLARLRRSDGLLWAAAAWICACLLPFLNLVAFLNYSLVSDRYMYLASAGASLVILRLASVLAGAPRAAWVPVTLGCLAAAFAAADARRSVLFADPLALWSKTASCAPGNPRARAALGAELLARGRMADAERELSRALELDPVYPEPYLDLARVLSETGRASEAASVARRRVELKADAAGWLAVGVYEMKAGRPKEGVAAIEEASRLDPGAPDVALSLGYAYLGLGRLADAERELTLASREARLRAKALSGLGELCARRGATEACARLYEESLSLDPWQAQAAKGLARTYAALGWRSKAAEVYDGFLERLESAIAAARLSGGPAADDMLRFAEDMRDEMKRSRSRVLGSPGRRRRR